MTLNAVLNVLPKLSQNVKQLLNTEQITKQLKDKYVYNEIECIIIYSFRAVNKIILWEELKSVSK